MPTFIEYELGEGQTILIEAPKEDAGGMVPAARDKDGNVIIRAKKTFQEAFKEAKLQAKLLIEQLEELPVGEAEIKFGLTTTGELGNIAVGKVGVKANYEVTLKWKKTI